MGNRCRGRLAGSGSARRSRTPRRVVDFTDEGGSSIVASLRLFKASEGDDSVTGGTLRIAGSGAWAVDLLGAVTPRRARRPVRFRSAGRQDRAAPGRAARCGTAAAWSAGRRLEDRRVARPARPARSRRSAGLQRHQGDPGATAAAMRRRGDAVAQIDATLHMRIAPDRWKAFVRPAKRVALGDRISFGHDGNACFLGKLEATVLEKGEAGEVTLRLRSVGRLPRRGAARGRPRAAAALYRLEAAGR